MGVVVTKEKLEVAKGICDAHLSPGIFNYEGWKYILEHHGGRLPLRIKAVPEGSVVPFRNGESGSLPLEQQTETATTTHNLYCVMSVFMS